MAELRPHVPPVRHAVRGRLAGKNVNGYVYTTAVPADPTLRIEGTEYSSRYQARVPRDGAFAAKMGAYLDTVLPVYGEHFADWWRDRLVPEMQRISPTSRSSWTRQMR